MRRVGERILVGAWPILVRRRKFSTGTRLSASSTFLELRSSNAWTSARIRLKEGSYPSNDSGWPPFPPTGCAPTRSASMNGPIVIPCAMGRVCFSEVAARSTEPSPQSSKLGFQLQPHGAHQSERIASCHGAQLAVVEPDLGLDPIAKNTFRKADATKRPPLRPTSPETR